MRRSGLSVLHKLVGVIVGLVGAIVLCLTLVFAAREVDVIHRKILNKADVYSVLAGKQLESAVAFDDRTTAQEVIDAFALDPDLVSAAVLGRDGAPLYQLGSPPQGFARLTAHQLRERGDTVVVAGPIIAPEGPRGAVVLELSFASARAEQAGVWGAAAAIGLGALAAGVLAAWGIAHSLARRLRRLATAAAAVAGGDLSTPRVVDHGGDEVGALARAFDAMVIELEAVHGDLERRIAERTGELRGANAQLQAEIAHRAQVEVELRQAQKLEAVGRLAAGVAHELNTPIQFVSDSCTFLRDASADMLALIARSAAILREVRDEVVTAEDGAAAYAEAARAASLDYLVDRVPASAQRAMDGLERIAAIVRSMKEFSHPGQRDQAPADLRRGLEATLEIARNEYKYVADVVTDFGAVPPVVCHIGELNQVFLNMIVNAAHAIEAAASPGASGAPPARGTITVRTWTDGPLAKVAIADSGAGIPERVRDRIFEPFFTTKAVGKGTGQGLAIARSVVDRHGGNIDVASEVGHGTTFTISIPIHGTTQRAAA